MTTELTFENLHRECRGFGWLCVCVCVCVCLCVCGCRGCSYASHQIVLRAWCVRC